MRKFLLGLVLLAAAPLAAHASTISYTLVLTSNNVQTGSGTLVVDSNATNTTWVTNDGGVTGGIDALSFTIGGNTFSLSPTAGPDNATYAEAGFGSGGVLTSLIFSAGPSTLNFNSGAFTYTYVDGNKTTLGTVTASLNTAPSLTAVPEPSSLVLLGSGFLGFAGLARRKFAR